MNSATCLCSGAGAVVLCEADTTQRTTDHVNIYRLQALQPAGDVFLAFEARDARQVIGDEVNMVAVDGCAQVRRYRAEDADKRDAETAAEV